LQNIIAKKSFKGVIMKSLLALSLLVLSSLAVANPPAPNPGPTPDVRCSVKVIALVKVKAGTENDFKRNALSILAPTRRENGNFSYNFQQSLQDSTTFATYEQWASVEDLNAHLQTAHMQAFFANVGAMFEAGYPVIETMKNIECP
jgi:quinol monooxygenase YgiN